MNKDISYDTNIENTQFVDNSNIFILLVVFAVLILLWASFSEDYQYDDENKEHMSGGTLTQLYAQDAQDVNLKSNVDQLATGQFDLYWNQPTMVANTFQNRGQSLPVVYVNNNITETNKNSNEKNKKNDQLKNQIKNKIKNKFKKEGKELTDDIDIKVNCNNYTDYVTGNNNFLNCLTDPNSCGNGPGGARLGSSFVQPVDNAKAKPFVGLNGGVVYPDSYVGSYFTLPNFDINKPYPVIFDKLY